MTSPEEPEVVTILRAVYHILKAPAGKDYLAEIAKQSDEFTANWCADNLTKLKEEIKKTSNETHTTNKVDSSNEIQNINQNENSSYTTINDVLPVEESSPTNDRKRKSTSVLETSENNTDQDLGEKKRCLDRQTEIEEAIRNKSMSGMKERTLLKEQSHLNQKMREIKSEDAEVIPVLDVIDFGAKSTAKLSSDDSEKKPSSSNDEEIDVVSFSDTESTYSVPHDISTASTSATSNNSSNSFSEQYIRPIDEEEQDEQIYEYEENVPTYRVPTYQLPTYPVRTRPAPTYRVPTYQLPTYPVRTRPAPTYEVVKTRKNEICGYRLGKTEYRCATCPKVFKNRYQLQSHSAVMHGFGDSQLCPYCQRNFTTERNFDHHVSSLCPLREHS